MGASEWTLAIDLGNGGPKVAIVADSDHHIAGTGFTPVAVTIGADGTATQDATEWDLAVRAAIAQAVDDAGADPTLCSAIAITGQWGSTVPVAADGEPAGPVLLWADTRARHHARRVVGGPISVGGFAPHKVLPWVRITGGAPSPSGADPTGHAALLANELWEVGSRTAWTMEPVDYLAYRFTDLPRATPASMILSWLTDNRPGAPISYDEGLIKRAGRRRDQLPVLVPTGSVQGPLTSQAADSMRLPAGIPVMTGLPDLHSAVIGSGAVAPYATHLALSTTAWLSARVPFKKTDVLHSIATVPGLDPHLPLVGNNLETGASALAWLREQIISPHDDLAGGGSGIGADGAAPTAAEPTYAELCDLAATAPPGSGGVLFAPWLAGERTPVEDKHLRGTWLGLSLRTDRAALVRSVLEGVAMNVNWMMTYYRKFLRRPVPSLRVLGGGAQSDLWAQILADVLAMPVERVADPMHAQLRGVALASHMARGRYTLEQAASHVRVDTTFRPDPASRAIYEAMNDEYHRLYGTLKSTYRRLNRD